MELLQSLVTGVRATVINQDGEPLRDAKVQVGSKIYNVTKNMAYFFLTLIPGDYKLMFSSKGYEPQVVAFNVKKDEIKDLSVVLKRSVSSDLNTDDILPNKTIETLMNLNSHYSQISEFQYIGRSLSGNRISSFKISSHKNNQFSKPSIAFLSGIGPGDPLTSKILISLASYILVNHDRRRKITSLLEKVDLYFLPVVHSSPEEKRTCSVHSDMDLKFSEPLNKDARIVVNWLQDVNPILTVNLKTGSRKIKIPPSDEKTEEFLQNLKSNYRKYNPIMNSTQVKNCDEGKKLLRGLPTLDTEKRLFS